ncbi:MAG: DMT family transporter [Candidatus Micrarchaeia archaeon]
MKAYLTIILYSFLAACSSILVKFLDGIDIFVITFFVLFFGAVTSYIYIKIKKEKIKIQKKRLLLIFGASQLGTWLFLYWSLLINPISVSMFLFYTAPVFVILLSPFLLKEKMQKITIILIAITILGIACIFNPINTLEYELSEIGMIFSILAAISYSINIILARKLKDNFNPEALSFFGHAIGSIIIVPVFLLFSNFDNIIITNLPIMCIMGILSGIAYLLIYYALRTIIAQKGSILTMSELVFATILGIILFNEMPTPLIILGGVLIIIAGSLTIYIKD